MIKFFFTIAFIFIGSCGDIEFVYKEREGLINLLYEKTDLSTSGFNNNFMNSYLPMLFGDNKENHFKLLININEKITKRSVETNQAASKLRYDLTFTYTLILNDKGCVVFKRDLLSYLHR